MQCTSLLSNCFTQNDHLGEYQQLPYREDWRGDYREGWRARSRMAWIAVA